MQRLGFGAVAVGASTVALVLALIAAAPVRADEGMWTFDNFPASAVKAKYGVDIDKPWLEKVRAATARLSVGCSASIVSGAGLMLTNNHCVVDCSHNLSDPAHDLVEDGFSGARERRCPDMEADVLISISDVTGEVEAAVGGRQGQDFVAARNAVVARIEESACAGKEAARTCEVVTLYQGGLYQLYVYDKFDDVRLVFAPESKTAFFGGDPDNFNFPRYDLDCAFLRLYRDGKPALTPAHLRWSAAPPGAAEPVFTVGNPGATDRLLTVDELQSLKSFILPNELDWFGELRGRLIEFSEEAPAQARAADSDLQDVENDFKELRGEFDALADPSLLAAKHADDAALQARIAADSALAGRTGDAFGKIASLQAPLATLWPAFALLEAEPALDLATLRLGQGPGAGGRGARKAQPATPPRIHRLAPERGRTGYPGRKTHRPGVGTARPGVLAAQGARGAWRRRAADPGLSRRKLAGGLGRRALTLDAGRSSRAQGVVGRWPPGRERFD